MSELEHMLRNEFAITQFILLTQNVTLWFMAFIKRDK